MRPGTFVRRLEAVAEMQRRWASKLDAGVRASVAQATKRAAWALRAGALQWGAAEHRTDRSVARVEAQAPRVQARALQAVEALRGAAPAATGAALARVAEAQQYLLEEAQRASPRGRRRRSRSPLTLPPLPVPRTLLGSFARKEAVVQDPAEVLRLLREGGLHADHVAALEAAWPPTAEHLRGRLALQIADQLQQGKGLSYVDRVAYSRLFRAPLEPTMDPVLLAQLQADIVAPPAAPAGPPPMPSRSGLVVPELAAAHKLHSERLERADEETK